MDGREGMGDGGERVTHYMKKHFVLYQGSLNHPVSTKVSNYSFHILLNSNSKLYLFHWNFLFEPLNKREEVYANV